MEVRLSPDGTPADVSGFIKGKVASVGDFPSSREGLLRTLGSDELIQALAVGQAPIVIHVELLTDPESPDGLLWSAPVESKTNFRSGTLGTAVIIVDDRRPISYLFSGG
jgi:HlyD family secretion protein